MSATPIIGRPFDVTLDSPLMNQFSRELVPVLVETDVSQRARLGFYEDGYRAVLEQARRVDPSLGEPLFAYADFGTPVRVVLSGGHASAAPLDVGPALDAVVPRATAAFEAAAEELERRDLATLEASDFAIESLPTRTDLLTVLIDWAEDRIEAAQRAASWGELTDREADAASRQFRRECERIENEFGRMLSMTFVEALEASRARDRSDHENPSLASTLSAQPPSRDAGPRRDEIAPGR